MSVTSVVEVNKIIQSEIYVNLQSIVMELTRHVC